MSPLTRMSLARRRSRHHSPIDVANSTIGNAMVVHAGDNLTDEAMSLAMAIAPDPDHDLVVLDLPADCPIAVWESVAACLPRGRRGVRLVVGGRSREATALAGQWLSQRIGRPVIAPDGVVLRGASGSLFVHSGRDTGWVRFQPGQPPLWEAKRFPRPPWEAKAFVEQSQTSSTGAAEPVPGGIWLRPAGHDMRLSAARRRLIGEMPSRPEGPTIVLGCPGTPAITLDDVLRFCVTVPADLLGTARFVHYGPVQVPAKATLGQALADGLRREVVCYTGMPIGPLRDPDVLTVRGDGSLGWSTFATRIAYQPQQNGDEAPPIIHGYRRPIADIPELSPGVFWYAPDAVIEVIQAGLWVRQPDHIANAAVVRAAPVDANQNILVFDAATQEHASRMQTLAEDVRRRLDPPTGRASILVPTTAMARPRVQVTGRALAALEAASIVVEAAAERTVAAPFPTSKPQLPPAERAVSISARLDSGGPVVQAPAPPAEVPASAALVSPVGEESTVEAPVVEPNTPAVAATVPSAPVVPYSPVSMRLESAPSEPPAPSGPPAPSKLPASADTPGVTIPGIPAAAAKPPSAASAPAAPKAPAPSTIPGTDAKRQPTPESAAVALLPAKGIDEERAWLRKNLGSQFGVQANTIARVLSEHPGFQGAMTNSSPDVLTEAVAVRLYLTERGAEVDKALRAATVGPHVPFARCVVAGLRRLPSHRGATVFSMTPTDSQWELYRGRKMFTEWGFVNALTQPCAGQEGDADVLVWSMTARRTKLLEPDNEPTEDRVLFMPGTSFKVLGMSDPEPGARGQILLRELAASEIDEDGTVDASRVSLDGLATESLRRCVERWSDGKTRRRIPESSMNRFQALPGLA
ncbi:hypothetical protein [Amycolatopsis sp. H20-H5]|uniref:hypothetical protein n=1 Tax=Amycolatopsis sp. H20-H5 TaxID=3046309 RepID=UPI002DBC767A|nr:hypothetical protein [Amycolatopsis sp. H20-H5]MEC3975216.1 hypothetical protein [Amycolatopsis sp. H20-H5]